MSRRQKAWSKEHGAWQYRPATPGFSLAEVLIAIAIISFALLALIGVLPEGLRSLQNAQRQEAEARIVQHLAARYQLKPWAELVALTGGADELDFDANGAPVTPSSNDMVYRARAEVAEAVPLPNETTASPFLRRLRIRITHQFNTSGAFDDPAKHRERWVSLVDLDKTPPTATSTEADSATASPVTGTTTNP